MNKVKEHTIPLFLRDSDDYEVGDPMWQSVKIHNICVRLLTYQPLTKGDMSFIKLQNEHNTRSKSSESKQLEE